MKYCISLLVIVTTVCHSCLCQQNTGDMTSFEWLIGTWDNLKTKPGEVASETWMSDASGALLGTGCTVRGRDTVFVEKLKIIEQAGKYYYVADVSHNAAPVYFEIVETGPQHFVSENPQHDFPKKITYRREGDILYAAIAGDAREIPFQFRRRE